MNASYFFIVIVTLFSFAAPLMAQGTQSAGSISATGAVSSPVSPQPIYGALQPIVTHQQEIIQDIYCIEPSQQLWIFELDGAPDAQDGSSGSHTVAGIGTWTPRTVEEYNWTEGYLANELTQSELLDLISTQSRAWILIGDLEGSCDSRTIMAIGLSRSVEGSTKNYLIPVIMIPDPVAGDLDLFVDSGLIFRAALTNCDQCDDGCCFEQYRNDMRAAVLDFKDRLKADFPISWKNVACFVGCVPALAGTPLVYAACVAACNGVFTIEGGINLVDNTQIYEADKENAKIKYCGCRDWQEINCPGGVESDQVGCP